MTRHPFTMLLGAAVATTLVVLGTYLYGAADNTLHPHLPHVPIAAPGAVQNAEQAGTEKGDADNKAAKKASFASDVKPYLAKHCYSCHGNGKKRGGLNLDGFTSEVSLLKNRAVWEHIAEMVRTKEMPPESRPRPAEQETAHVLAAIHDILTNIDCGGEPNAGRVTLRRLNRNEYNNTIRDLLGVDFKPAADFPPDDVGYGFDNIGDVLTMSPLLLEKYLAAAETILGKVIVIPENVKPSVNRIGGLRATPDAGDRAQGGAFLTGKGEVYGFTNFLEGDYKIRAVISGIQVGKEPIRGILRLGTRELKKFEHKGKQTVVETSLRVPAGSNKLSVVFLNPFRDEKIKDRNRQRRQLFVRSIEVEGPFNAPASDVPEPHRRLFAHKKGLSERDAAKEIVGRFAMQAFRRPVEPAEVEKLLGLYDRARKKGDRFEHAVRMSLYRILVSPHFLFRVELDPANARAGKAYPVSDYALASRLSYFLWSTMPDQELFDLAEKGQLRANLKQQVRRMLEDRRSSSLVKNFAGQWLTLRQLEQVSPDPKFFPKFTKQLRADMRRETEMFFEAILRDDRSVVALLDAEFSFINERLARHYGMEGVRGNFFRKVKMPDNRRGILMQASILTITSYPTRTSPVQRGKWVLEQILNAPPPPPPPNVPEIDNNKELTGTLREIMEQHRKNPVCASCHKRMDAIGFAFENYDAVGAWRDKEGKFDIDPAGVLPDGKSFTGPVQLRQILVDKKDMFCRCLAEKLLTYALGRGLEYYDKCAIDKILIQMERSDYRFSALIDGIVTSDPFLMRTAVGTQSTKKLDKSAEQ